MNVPVKATGIISKPPQNELSKWTVATNFYSLRSEYKWYKTQGSCKVLSLVDHCLLSICGSLLNGAIISDEESLDLIKSIASIFHGIPNGQETDYHNYNKPHKVLLYAWGQETWVPFLLNTNQHCSCVHCNDVIQTAYRMDVNSDVKECPGKEETKFVTGCSLCKNHVPLREDYLLVGEEIKSRKVHIRANKTPLGPKNPKNVTFPWSMLCTRSFESFCSFIVHPHPEFMLNITQDFWYQFAAMRLCELDSSHEKERMNSALEGKIDNSCLKHVNCMAANYFTLSIIMPWFMRDYFDYSYFFRFDPVEALPYLGLQLFQVQQNSRDGEDGGPRTCHKKHLYGAYCTNELGNYKFNFQNPDHPFAKDDRYHSRWIADNTNQFDPVYDTLDRKQSW